MFISRFTFEDEKNYLEIYALVFFCGYTLSKRTWAQFWEHLKLAIIRHPAVSGF
jgi:hypothetical protein